jgi:hypothetical protein
MLAVLLVVSLVSGMWVEPAPGEMLNERPVIGLITLPYAKIDLDALLAELVIDPKQSFLAGTYE